MRKTTRLGAAAGALLAASLVSTAGAAADATRGGCQTGCTRNVVFVQTDNALGNQIVAYRRAADGTLSWSGIYNTGGLGGVLSGSVADHLASQGSLTYDPWHGLLYAVNAGSGTVSVFAVEGDRLALRQVVDSGGHFPVSVAVHDDTVYVLNALDGGSIQGYRVTDDSLHAIRTWHRSLGLDPNATPQFTTTPGQVGFTADGAQLVVTTKANTNAFEVFRLGPDGGPDGAPTTTVAPGSVPFGFAAADQRLLFVAQAGPNAVASVRVGPDGTVTQLTAAPTAGAATCWVTVVGDYLYASNAGSSTLTGFRIGAGGQLTPAGTTATDPGTVDSAATPDHRFLYVQTGVNGVVDEFAVHADGSLTEVGTQPVPNGVGGEGIVAL